MSLVRARLDGEILIVTFEDSSSRNSWSLTASRELRELLKTQDGRFRALVFESVGRVFCSGGNLSDYAALTKAEEGRAINDAITADLAALSTLKVPSICLVGGDCFGGGVELVSAFDFVISAPHVFFGLWQKKIGLSFGWGGGARLERRVGATRLREWSMSARSLTSGEVRDAGLVDEIVLRDDLLVRGLEVARRLASGSPEAIASLKGFDSSRERDIFHSLWWSDEHRKVLRSRKRT
ncbi:MAG: enoyl-CoA hydratase/isomerase family protein [Bdellovibrionota bacterium]